MAGKGLVEYWFRNEKKLLVLKDKKMYEVAKEIGLDLHYLSNILNRNMPIKHKAMAYAISKYAGPNFEIDDLFDKKM